jgi:hypothetical protein
MTIDVDGGINLFTLSEKFPRGSLENKKWTAK